MIPIDEVQLNFSPQTLNVLNIILGLIVFGVALDIKVQDFKTLIRNPKPFIIGAASQFVLFPLIAFLEVYFLHPQPSIALGILLVGACPGGNISNFMTQHADGNIALSIAMSAFSTALATVMTPFNVSLYADQIEGTRHLMQNLSLNPWDMLYLIAVLMLVPMSLGMYVSHRCPEFAARLKRIMKIASLTFFVGFLVFAFVINFKYISQLQGVASISVILLNFLGFTLGYLFAKTWGLSEKDSRAVSIETGIQNSGLALILIFNFFDGLGGMAVIAAFWGIWHIFAGLILSTWWSRKSTSLIPSTQ
ncbi:MAG: bile acid:sodium symporter family protein [Saprospiraceae bacterium]|nr:bile acid:sodium symporter family protein [Saprospiraceae bacterium]